MQNLQADLLPVHQGVAGILERSAAEWLTKDDLITLFNHHRLHPLPLSTVVAGPAPLNAGIFIYNNKPRFTDHYDWIDVEEDRRRNCRSYPLGNNQAPRIRCAIVHYRLINHAPVAPVANVEDDATDDDEEEAEAEQNHDVEENTDSSDSEDEEDSEDEDPTYQPPKSSQLHLSGLFSRFGVGEIRAFLAVLLMATTQGQQTAIDPAVLDDIIRRLTEIRLARPGKQVQLSEAEIKQLCTTARDILLEQPNLLELEAPIQICGDIHGQYSDLLRLFEYGGFPPSANYLFLGGYMDRGKQSRETIRLTEVRLARPGKQVEIKQLCTTARDVFLQQPSLLELEAPIKICGDIDGQYSDLLRLFEYGGFPPSANYMDQGKPSLETIRLLLAYKIKYPGNFFLLRGNHECAYDVRKRRFNVRVWEVFTDCFSCLPVAALIDDTILCMHGGLSPELNHLDEIRGLTRPTMIPDTGLLCDLLWSDPGKDVKGWGANDRGVSYTFGPDKVSEFLTKHDLDLVCRAHQVVEDGYEFFADRQLVTVFSAPNYCGEFDNAGAMMSVDENLMCSFQIFKPAEKKAKFMMSTKI
ncbi:unnamed protein product [Microthlaspi erraticum]|uniref:Serine/threonine-protein phosphatase n=1 Tax=Microthlaspi erraticum TaxID=1685480 RepID=A0A6D2IQS5_9BRAS|nr:unnamed protein product [Microthlaspi erraticum]